MKHKYEIRQHDREDCAVACIASIASYYGLDLPLITIREKCGTSEDGTSIKGISDAAKRIGFSAKALKSTEKELSSLTEIEKPIILHTQKEDGWLHFVVLYELSQKRALIMDPGEGKLIKIAPKKLKEMWTGYLVLLSPLPDFEQGDKRIDIFQRMKELLLLNKKELIYSLIGSVVYILVGLSTSIFLQQIIDKVLPSKNYSLLLIFSVIMILLSVISLFLGYFKSVLTLRASIKIDSKLILSYVNHLFRLPASFFTNRTVGDLNSRISDAYRIRSFISIRLTIIVISVVSLFASFILLFTYYWKLAILTMLFVPLYALLYYISKRIYKKVNKEIIESSAKFEESTIENLSVINTIKNFGAQDNFSKKAESKYVDMSRKFYKGGKYISLFSTYSEAITKSLTLLILIVGSIFFFNSELTIGELVSFYSVISFFSSPIVSLVESSDEISEAQISANRLFEILDYPEEENSEITFTSPFNLKNDITIKDISFSYPGQLDLINGLSCSIKSGEITTILGDNGSGKSTFVSLLMKVYQPTHGIIEIENVNLQYISTTKWREYISIAPQNPDIFSGTILENIVPNEESADIQKVITLCEELGLDKMLDEREGGLFFNVGEHGKLLSGGEKQKLSLARALYREPSILILDEATSALDKDGKYIVNTLLKKLASEGKTIIVVSHDGESLKLADNIINLNTNAHSKAEAARLVYCS